MDASSFDLASFYVGVGALPREHAALRQNLVRGLKDYFRSVWGYDRYGAETIFMLQDHMNLPHIYGFGAVRIVHDRRISQSTKVAAALLWFSLLDHEMERGRPYGLTTILLFLAQQNRLPVELLRFGLISCAGHARPFEAMDKNEAVAFAKFVMSHEEMPAPERLFWMHTLICRHGDLPGTAELTNVTIGNETTDIEDRIELCRAWLHFRQPRLTVNVPIFTDDVFSPFVVDRLEFWVAHMPSWPGGRMVQLALVWLARLTERPEQIVAEFETYSGPHAEYFRSAVADVLLEHHAIFPVHKLRRALDKGVLESSSGTERRKFYRVGLQLFGSEYLVRASADTSGTVRQWAARERTKLSENMEAANL